MLPQPLIQIFLFTNTMKQVKKKFLIQHYHHLHANDLGKVSVKMLKEILTKNFDKYDDDVIDNIEENWVEVLKKHTMCNDSNSVLNWYIQESQIGYTSFDEDSLEILGEIICTRFDYEQFKIMDLLKHGVIVAKYDSTDGYLFEDELKIFSYNELLNDFKFYKTNMPCGKL